MKVMMNDTLRKMLKNITTRRLLQEALDMSTSHKFDATELGLLHKHDFIIIIDGIAEKTVGTLYTEIVKHNSGLFETVKEQEGLTLISTHDSLRKALGE